MAEVGRPTLLDDEFYLKIKELVIHGKEMTEVAEALEVPYKTMESWKTRNYQGFADRYDGYKRDRYLVLAEGNIPSLLLSADEKVRADMTKFVTETLGKQNYSKRSEMTGKDGEALTINVTSFDDRHTLPVHASAISVGLPESTAEIQDRSVSPESGQIQISPERSDS